MPKTKFKFFKNIYAKKKYEIPNNHMMMQVFLPMACSDTKLMWKRDPIVWLISDKLEFYNVSPKLMIFKTI